MKTVLASVGLALFFGVTNFATFKLIPIADDAFVKAGWVSPTITPDKPEEKTPPPICEPIDKIDDMMHSKGFYELVEMVNSNGLKESVWIGNRNVIITAKTPDEKKVCLITELDQATYNGHTIQKLYEQFKKAQGQEV